MGAVYCGPACCRGAGTGTGSLRSATPRAAALPPQPLPFLGAGCCAAGRLGAGLGPGREGLGACGFSGGGALGPGAGDPLGAVGAGADDAGLGGTFGAIEWGVFST